MRFITFKSQLSPFIVFSLKDIQILEPDFDRRRLTEWQKKDYIQKIIKGYYVFKTSEINEQTLFLIANKINKPSYVSLESALQYYNFIPEGVYTITSISSKKTASFSTAIGNFQFRHLKPNLMFGYQIIPYLHHVIKIAEPEKALIDYLYLNPHLKTITDLKSIRLNKDQIASTLNSQKINTYLQEFNNSALTKRAKSLLSYLNK